MLKGLDVVQLLHNGGFARHVHDEKREGVARVEEGADRAARAILIIARPKLSLVNNFDRMERSRSMSLRILVCRFWKCRATTGREGGTPCWDSKGIPLFSLTIGMS